MRGVFSDAQLRTVDGYELLSRVVHGRIAHAPIYRTMGVRLLEVKEGEVLLEAAPFWRFYNPIGSIHGGYVATLLDTRMGCAVHSRLSAGTTYATVSLAVNYVRALTQKTGPVRARGSVTHLGGRVATAEGALVDAVGKVYAHGLCTCAVFAFEAPRKPSSR